MGISPLMLAAMNGHTAAVKLLLDMGSDVNAQVLLTHSAPKLCCSLVMKTTHCNKLHSMHQMLFLHYHSRAAAVLSGNSFAGLRAFVCQESTAVAIIVS